MIVQVNRRSSVVRCFMIVHKVNITSSAWCHCLIIMTHVQVTIIRRYKVVFYDIVHKVDSTSSVMSLFLATSTSSCTCHDQQPHPCLEPERRCPCYTPDTPCSLQATCRCRICEMCRHRALAWEEDREVGWRLQETQALWRVCASGRYVLYQVKGKFSVL